MTAGTKKTSPPQDRGGSVKQAALALWPTPARPKGRVVSFFKVTKKLAPGIRGVRKLKQRYNDELVCYRYRMTLNGGASCSTVEAVLEQVPIRSRASRLVGSSRLLRKGTPNYKSRLMAAFGTPYSACGACRIACSFVWGCLTVFPLWRNEISMDFMFSKMLCLFGIRSM